MQSVKVLLEGLASVFEGMVSTPLTTVVSVVVAVLTLVLLDGLAKQ